MYCKRKYYICMAAIGFGLFSIAGALFAKEKDQNLISKLKSTDYSKGEEKQKIIKDISHRKRKLTDAMKSELIGIFDNEFVIREKYIEDLKSKGLSVQEANDEALKVFHNKVIIKYYAELAALIASFKDSRGVPSLLRGIGYYGPSINPGTVASMGEGVVEILLNTAKSDEKMLKNMAFFVLSVWVNAPVFAEDYSITEDMRINDKHLLNKIKLSFLEGLRDSDIDVRSHAVYGLGAFPEKIVIDALEKVATEDTGYYEESKEYPVRGDAQKALKKIKSHSR